MVAKDQGQSELHKKHMKQYIRIVGIEVVSSFVLLLVVYFSLIHNLWDQQYINTVVDSWEQGPITDLKEILPKEKCDAETMIKYGVTAANADLLKNGKFKIIGQGYWWNMLKGCQCPAASPFSEARPQRCTDQQTASSCHNVADSDSTMRLLPIVNGKKLCAFIDSSYNSLNIQKPTRENNDWTCKNSTVPQLCGYASLSIQHVNCIPKEAKCPLTHVEYDTNNEVVTSSDPKYGKPLIDMFLSENGPPCVHWTKNYNTYTNKTMATLFNPLYIIGCPELNIDGHVFTTSDQYKKVQGFQQTNEKQLLIENQYRRSSTYPKQWNYVLEIARFDQQSMQDYVYDMYEKRYSHINEGCEYNPHKTPAAVSPAKPAAATTPAKPAAVSPTKPAATTPSSTKTPSKKEILVQPTELFSTDDELSFGQEKQIFVDNVAEYKHKNGTVEIKSEDMPFINDIANKMVTWVSSLVIFIHILFWTGLFELAMVFMQKEGALPKKVYDWIILVRRIVQVICVMVVFFTIWGVYQWTGHRLINGLANHKCSADPMLQDTFKYMKIYLDNSQDIQRKTFMYVILGIVIGTNMFGIYHKYLVCDKSFDLPANYVEQAQEQRVSKTKIEQIGEPLIGKDKSE